MPVVRSCVCDPVHSQLTVLFCSNHDVQICFSDSFPNTFYNIQEKSDEYGITERLL